MAYDLNGDGVISQTELAAMFESAWQAGIRGKC